MRKVLSEKGFQVWTSCAPDVDRACSGAQKLWDDPDNSGAQTLPCKKEKKSLDLQIYSQIGKTMKNL